MGNFYTNISLRTDDQDLILKALREQHHIAFVSAPKSGWIVVYAKDIEGASLVEVGLLARDLSKICLSVSVAVSNYDDDFLWLQICNAGEFVDEYNSAPGYFEHRGSLPSGGDGRTISTVLESPSSEALVREILHSRPYAVETERHMDLAKSLELPLSSVGFGYRYIEQGELPAELQVEDLVHLQ